MSKPPPEAFGAIVLLAIFGFLMKALILVWGSNVLADSINGWTGLSMREGILLVIFHSLFTAKTEVKL
jgi:hypothetical protein